MRRFFLKRFVWLPISLIGCAAPALTHSPEILQQHVIVVDGNGQPHDPASPDGKAYAMTDYRKQLAKIFAGMDAYHKQHPGRKVLVFVHGGLNSLTDSLTAADQEMDPAMRAGYYPIYLDWNSALLDTYGQHVFALTQGQTNTTIGRYLLAPCYVVSDVGRALLRAPLVWINQISGDIQGAGSDVYALPHKEQITSATQPVEHAQIQRWATGEHGVALAKLYEQLRQSKGPQDKPQPLHIFIGRDFDVNAGHMAWLGGTYAVTLVPKLVLQPLIDWLGTPAWDVMTRRTLIAFDGQLGGNFGDPTQTPSLAKTRESRWKDAQDFSSTGAMEIFRQQLEHVTAQNADENDSYHVTLVAHSAGTLVMNEWLRRDMLEKKQQQYPQIVYMAAACSVRDFSRAVVPYLLEHPQTQFYSLMLHPLAELRERIHFYDLPPRGSLLVWLDDYLTNPLTPLDRTLGRWDNIIQAIDAIPESVRSQVSLKAFPLAPTTGRFAPQSCPITAHKTTAISAVGRIGARNSGTAKTPSRHRWKTVPSIINHRDTRFEIS